MVAFILRRLVLTLPVVWIVMTLVFGLIHMVPGDPVAQMLGEGASATQVERLRHELGLDRPVLDQYRAYMAGVLRGDLGTSFRNQESVLRSILTRYPATIELAVASTIFSIIVALPFGVISAIRRGRAADRMISFVSLLGISLPNFALGPMLILLFSIMLGLLPVSGRGGLLHLMLPAFTLEEVWRRRQRAWSEVQCWKKSARTMFERRVRKVWVSVRCFFVMRCETVSFR